MKTPLYKVSPYRSLTAHTSREPVFENIANIQTYKPGWCQPVRQEFMENECEALPGVAYPGVRDNCSTINTKTGYDEYDDDTKVICSILLLLV